LATTALGGKPIGFRVNHRAFGFCLNEIGWLTSANRPNIRAGADIWGSNDDPFALLVYQRAIWKTHWNTPWPQGAQMTALSSLQQKIHSQKIDNPAMYGAVNLALVPARLVRGDAPASDLRGG